MAARVQNIGMSPTDICLTAPDPSLAHRALDLGVPAHTAVLRGVRAAVHAWLDSVEEPLEHWDVVVTELVTNAIAASPGHDQIKLAMHLAAGTRFPARGPRVSCSVANPGIWNLDGMEPPIPLDLLIARSSQFDASTPSGRGLRIVSALTSGGEVNVENGSTTVTVWLDRSSDVWFASSAPER